MPRPKADIDPLKVIELVSEGAKVVEVADYFGVHKDVIHDRFPSELRKGKHNLKQSLRMSQIAAAKSGNATMLIWLGKQYLGQSDATLDDYILEALETAGLTKEDLLDLIKNKDILQATQKKKTFTEFCVAAGYPAPFQEQVDMMEFALLLKVTRLLLGSRGYGKTDYLTILGVAYLIYLNPTEFRALIITKSKVRNAAIIGEIQQACMLNGVIFDKANASLLRARGLHGKDASVEAVTIRTKSLRGRHPDIILMDDPVTEDDVSAATREHTERVYFEAMKLTMNICIIGQPAHKDDLYGHLREIVKTKLVPWGTIPELDADLKAQRAAGVSEESISASYHLKVLAEGTTPFDAVKYCEQFPIGNSAVAFIDPSDGGDYTAMSIVVAMGGGQSIAVLGYAWKRAWHHVTDEIVAHIQRCNVKELAFETNVTGTQPLDLLRGLLPGIGVTGIHSNSNKHSRIMAAGAFAPSIFLSKESDSVYLKQTTKYELGSKFDDCPDSLASCLQWIGLSRGK